MFNNKDTIYALSTTYAKSGVAIIRISGEKALNALKILRFNKEILPRKAYYSKLFHPEENYVIDNALILYFESPHSFTGEDIVELHLHGSKAVINVIISILEKQNFLRLAEPGEFSKRAFLNNKMDLTQSEGLADLIEAETEMQLKQAIKQVNGDLKNLYEFWRTKIVEMLALTEAFIDFPEEEIPEDIINDVEDIKFQITHEIENHLDDNKIGEKIRDGIKVAIIGSPNVGKSSLLNALAKRDVAIVSNIAGTTRDAIEVGLNINGYAFNLVDTAGIRESDDVIEKIGIEIAKQKYEEADLVIEVYDINNHLAPYIDDDKPKIKIINKIDLLTNKHNPSLLPISVKNNIGIDKLINFLSGFAKNFEVKEESPIISRTRYREHLIKALLFLDTFSLNNPIELAAEDLRSAATEIGKITGRISVDDILDVIFSSFCIGK